jgi:hypothetical protein
MVRILKRQWSNISISLLLTLYPVVHQANYINALAVSVLPFFEPAEVTLGGSIFFSWVDFLGHWVDPFFRFGELFKIFR